MRTAKTNQGAEQKVRATPRRVQCPGQSPRWGLEPSVPRPFHLSNQMPKDEHLQGQVTKFSAQLFSSFGRKTGFLFLSGTF